MKVQHSHLILQTQEEPKIVRCLSSRFSPLLQWVVSLNSTLDSNSGRPGDLQRCADVFQKWPCLS